jgi:hypothetical protein
VGSPSRPDGHGPAATAAPPGPGDRVGHGTTWAGWLPLIGVLLTASAALWLVLGLLAFPGNEGWGYDFLAYRDASVRLAEGGSLYQEETLAGAYRPGPYGLYMYAPPLGVAIGPLAGLPVDAGTMAWFLLHVAALVVACAIMPIRPPLRLIAFGVSALSYAATRDLVLGNISVMLLLPMAMAWRWLDRPIGAVAQAVAISIRPTLGVILIWQVLRRRWSALAWTLGAGAVLVTVTLPFVGIDGYRDYLTVLRNMSQVTGVERNYDLGSTLLLLGADQAVANLGLLAGYAIAIGAVVLSLRRDPEVGFMVALTASLLLAPLLWDHYLAMLVLPAAFMAQRGRPWALALPLLSWLPAETYPFTVLLALGLVFVAREADMPQVGQPMQHSRPPEPMPYPPDGPTVQAAPPWTADPDPLARPSRLDSERSAPIAIGLAMPLPLRIRDVDPRHGVIDGSTGQM